MGNFTYAYMIYPDPFDMILPHLQCSYKIHMELQFTAYIVYTFCQTKFIHNIPTYPGYIRVPLWNTSSLLHTWFHFFYKKSEIPYMKQQQLHIYNIIKRTSGRERLIKCFLADTPQMRPAARWQETSCNLSGDHSKTCLVLLLLFIKF